MIAAGKRRLNEHDSLKQRTTGAAADDTARTLARLERRLRLARLVLLWERTWPALVPPLGIGALFLALSLLGMWEGLPPAAHGLGLIVFAAAFAWAVVYGLPWDRGHGLAALRLPSRREAMRRIEGGEGLANRPLDALDDRLAVGAEDPGSESLWQLHRRRISRIAERLRVGPPHPPTARRDPYGIRQISVLLLLVGFAVAGADWRHRLESAVIPAWTVTGPSPVSVDAWIAPPAYTGAAPIFLAQGTGRLTNERETKRIEVPEGSRLVARVHGISRPPRLIVSNDTEGSDAAIDFTPIGERDHELDEPVRPGTAEIRGNGDVLARWSVAIDSDAPPSIELLDELETTMSNALRIAYVVADDYGVVDARARLTLDSQALQSRAEAEMTAPASARTESHRFDLPLPGLRVTRGEDIAYRDLTPHVWAGLPVTMVLEAEDEAGQIGESAPVSMVLPAREFHHPVARALIEERRSLALDPAHASRAAQIFDALSISPEHFYDDSVVYLALRIAHFRLSNAGADAVDAELLGLLWDTALRIEDGDLSIAQRELRELQEELMRALAEGASEAEIARLMEELRDAIGRYLQAMLEQALRAAQESGEVPAFDPGERTVDDTDLSELLDRAQELSQSGAREAARELLSQLQDMLEGLQMGVVPVPMTGEQQALSGALGDLSDLINRQQELLDETFRNNRGGQPGPGESQGGGEGQPGGETGAQAQEGVRRGLGDVMRRLGQETGEIPGSLGRAERAMRDAAEALRGGDGEGALDRQERALDQLREGAQAVAEALREQSGDSLADGDGDGRAIADDEDPLGRPVATTGPDLGNSVSVPDELEVQRARRILEELKRRASELGRPKQELDYLERLLDFL